MNDTIERSQTHATFVLERTYDAAVARVWHALSDGAARAEWFTGGDDVTTTESSHDFRVGGQTVDDGQWHGGPRSRFVATYTDIVEERRIVYAYDMWLDGRHISTSIGTMALQAQDDGTTRLTYTERGVHLDGLDTPQQREEGTAGLLDLLASFLHGRTA